MAQITLNIPDGALPRIVDAIASLRGYDPTVHGTKAQFAKRHLITYIKNMVVEYEGARDTDILIREKRTSVEAIDIT